MTEVYFEDLREGQVRELGSFTARADEMVEFAERFDPQPFHVDRELAKESMYDGIIASGWYTASACMRLLVDGFFSRAASMGAFGLEELAWRAPVRPNDTIDVRNEILEVRPSGSRNDRGYVTNRTIGDNQDGDEVIYWIGVNIFGTREGG